MEQKKKVPAKAIIRLLDLQPNTVEGGYFAGTYPPADMQNPPSSAIYYFLGKSDRSVMHQVKGDMLYHFYKGDPVEMLLLYPEGSPVKSEVVIFSNDIVAGGRPMMVIPGGTWIGSRVLKGGSWSLMGVTMAPPFNPAEYAIGNRDKLIAEYPKQRRMIIALTNPVE